jgi:hypothetical protein
MTPIGARTSSTEARRPAFLTAAYSLDWGMSERWPSLRPIAPSGLGSCVGSTWVASVP